MDVEQFFLDNIGLRKSDLRRLAIDEGIARDADDFERLYANQTAINITARPEKTTRYHIEEYPGLYMMDIIFFRDPTDKLWDMLLLVHCASRKIWLKRIESKSSAACKDAFLEMEKDTIGENEGDIDRTDNFHKYYKFFIDTIMCDKDKGFSGGVFKEELDKRNIQLVQKDPTEHNILGILERVVQFIKPLFNRQYEAIRAMRIRNNPNGYRGSLGRNDIDNMIDTVVNNYNKKTPLKKLYNFTPEEVWVDPKIQLKIFQISTLMNNILLLKQRERDRDNHVQRLEPNYRVRILDRKTDKLHTRRKYFSNEFYQISKKNNFSYNIKNYKTGKPIEGKYKRYELRRVNDDEIELPKRKRTT